MSGGYTMKTFESFEVFTVRVCVCVCTYAHADTHDSVLDLRGSVFNIEISYYAFMDSIGTARKWLLVYNI